MPNIILFFCFCLNHSSCPTLSGSCLETGPSLKTQMEFYLHHEPFSQMEPSATCFSSTLLIVRAPSLSTLFTMSTSSIIYQLDHILVICCISDLSLRIGTSETYSSLYFQIPAQCLTHRKYSVNISE